MMSLYFISTFIKFEILIAYIWSYTIGVKWRGMRREDDKNVSMISGGTRPKNAPEELYFKSTKIRVANRNALPGKILKKLARKPYKEFN